MLETVRDRILGLADLQPGKRILDLGCGTGLLGLRAMEIVGDSGLVVFLDISRSSLIDARQHGIGRNSTYIQGSALPCPLVDQSVDVVVVRSVLIYLADKGSAAREIARVLRPGGCLALHEPINRRMEPIIDFGGFEDVPEAALRAKDLHPLCDFDEDDLRRALETAGFSVELQMEETRWPVRGREWAHGFRFGAPKGYSGYDMLLAAGISEQRAEEFVAAGERQIGDEWRIMTCPVTYIRAVKQ
jgi:SAM-dependent methyltransferase